MKAAIKWRDAKTELPDSDTDVLIFIPDEDGQGEVWMGHHDGEDWRDALGGYALVSHWADVPSGPGDPPRPEQKWRSATIEDVVRTLRGEKIDCRFKASELADWKLGTLAGYVSQKERCWICHDRDGTIGEYKHCAVVNS